MKRFQHKPYLDGLRGIAVLMVIFFHNNSSWMRGGFIGVDVFFVLSGYLITSLLLNEWQRFGSISLKNFYMRRVLRLFPALALFLIVCTAMRLFHGKQENLPFVLMVSVFYAMNFAIAYQWRPLEAFDGFGHLWSLSIEEQFYLLFPVLLMLLLRFKASRQAVIAFLSLGIITPMLLRFLLWEADHNDRLYFALDTRADGLLIGCLVGLLASWDLLPQKLVWRRLTGVLGIMATAYLLFLAIGFPFGSQYPTTANFLYLAGGFSLVNLSVAVVLVTLLVSKPKFIIKVLEIKKLTWVGRISYGLYLWHVPVIAGFFTIPLIQGLCSLLFFDLPVYRLGMTFGLACASFYLVEKPFLKLKERFSAGSPQKVEQSAPIPMTA